MKGAAPVALRNIKAPNRSSTMMTGMSHHFLLVLAKSQNSRIMPIDGRAASASNRPALVSFLGSEYFTHPPSELSKVTLSANRWLPADPIAFGLLVEPTLHLVAPENPKRQPKGGEEPVVGRHQQHL